MNGKVLYRGGGGGSGVDEPVMKGMLEKKIATIFQQMVKSFEFKIYLKFRYTCIVRTIFSQFVNLIVHLIKFRKNIKHLAIKHGNYEWYHLNSK